jgi:hypothetical protein
MQVNNNNVAMSIKQILPKKFIRIKWKNNNDFFLNKKIYYRYISIYPETTK